MNKISNESIIKKKIIKKINTHNDTSTEIEDRPQRVSFKTESNQGEVINLYIHTNILIQKEILLERKLKKHIKDSHDHILGLENNWDGEDSKKIDIQTVKRSNQFINAISSNLLRYISSETHLPLFLPSGKGSIDIQWDTEFFELSVNIPEDYKTPIAIYAEDNRKNEIELHGEDWINNKVLLNWLKKTMG